MLSEITNTIFPVLIIAVFLMLGTELYMLAIYRRYGNPSQLRSRIYTLESMPMLPKHAARYHELLLKHQYRPMGALLMQPIHWLPGTTIYLYLAHDGKSYAELTSSARIKLMTLNSHFADRATIITGFPVGYIIHSEQLQVDYARRNPEAALKHHQQLIATWTEIKGAPTALETLEDVIALDDKATHIHSRALFQHKKQWRQIMLGADIVVIILLLSAMFVNLMGNEGLFLTLLGIGSLSFLMFQWFIQWQLERPPYPLDQVTGGRRSRVRQPLAQDGSLLLLMRFLDTFGSILMLFIAFVVVYFAAADVRYFQNGSWERIEIPGRLEDIVGASDGSLWGVDPRSIIIRWNGERWDQVQWFNDNALYRDLDRDGTVLWIITSSEIFGCNTSSLRCFSGFLFEGGVSIAAANGRVIAVSEHGMFAFFTGTGWQQVDLSDMLPGFDFDAARGRDAQVALTDDGTAWIQWGQAWYENQLDQWQVVSDGAQAPVMFNMIGVEANYVWAGWANGLTRETGEDAEWELFTWEQIGRDVPKDINDFATDSEGVVWIAADDSLIRQNNDRFTIIPLADAVEISDVTFTNGDRLWVQVTKNYSVWYLMALAPMLLCIAARIIFFGEHKQHYAHIRATMPASMQLNSEK